MSTSSLDNYYPTIIRLLDVQAIGPYLVQRGVLSSHEYYDTFAGPLEKGETSNYKLSMKLGKKCLKKPKEFHEALEESLSRTQHTNHHELLELLPNPITGEKKNVTHKVAHKVKNSTAFSRQKSDDNILTSNNGASNHDMNGWGNDDVGTKQRTCNGTRTRNGTISLSEISKDHNSFVPSNESHTSWSLPPTFDQKLQHARSTGSLNIPMSCDKRYSVGHTESSRSETASPQLSPTISPRHQRAGSFSSPLSFSTTAATFLQEKTDKEMQDLYQQSKLEVERLKEKNEFQAESLGKLQLECNELRNQVREFERMKERSSLLEETLEKTKEENQKLNQQLLLTKIEANSLTEKLAAKIESEEVLKEAKLKLEENLQTMHVKCENLAVQLESTNVKLESKLEKINSMEAQNKELHKQVNELKQKVSQQQTQLQNEQNIHQRELEKEQQKCHELQCQIQEKDKKISFLEGKMEVTSLNLKQLQESIATLNEKETAKSTPKTNRFSKLYPNGANTSIMNARETDCTKQDLIEIVESHVDQIEALHQKIFMYQREIANLQQKLKCVL